MKRTHSLRWDCFAEGRAKFVDLEHVDMSKGGAQGDVFVSKGTASTVVSLMPHARNRSSERNQFATIVNRPLQSQRTMDHDMAIYAWKISAPGRPDVERIGTLADLESHLDASELPGASPSKDIIARTLLMQTDGQGFYKSSADLEDRCYSGSRSGADAMKGHCR